MEQLLWVNPNENGFDQRKKKLIKGRIDLINVRVDLIKIRIDLI